VGPAATDRRYSFCASEGAIERWTTILETEVRDAVKDVPSRGERVRGPGRVLVVDDAPQNVRLLDAVLSPRGYDVVSACSGEDALAKARSGEPDLVLLDVLMPGMDGYEVCRRLRAEASTRFLPVIMLTASGEEEKLKALEAGADDFVHKPFDQPELLARVRSLLRIKRFQDELAELNRTLESRVEQQVEALQRAGQLKRFLSPQLAELVLSGREPSLLETHRAEITAVFCDLRGFTAFAETEEPEEVMVVLRQYHEVIATLVLQFGATVSHVAGDGMLAFFNDPLPCPDPAGQAIRMALAIRDEVGRLARSWQQRGHELGVGIGVALGHATLGTIGAADLFHYASVGAVTNLAARLSDVAAGGQILMSARVHAATEHFVDTEPIGLLTLKGFARPMPAFSALALRTG
jgi:class 3 adenylate cyclase